MNILRFLYVGLTCIVGCTGCTSPNTPKRLAVFNDTVIIRNYSTVELDDKEVLLTWKAAVEGDADAAYALFFFYEQQAGNDAVIEAATWHRVSISLGHPLAEIQPLYDSEGVLIFSTHSAYHLSDDEAAYLQQIGTRKAIKRWEEGTGKRIPGGFAEE